MPVKKALPKPTPQAAPAKKAAKKASTKTAYRSAPVDPKRRVYSEKEHDLARQRMEILGPLPEPHQLPGADQSADSIAGQTWEFLGTDAPKKKELCHFFEDGSLTYDGSPGLWKQHGAALVFELNGRYVDYRGVINGGTASGSANNIVKYQWTWTAERI